MNPLPIEIETEDDYTSSSNRVLQFPTNTTGFKTNTFPLPTRISEGIDSYVKNIVYSILYSERILQYLSSNNSFDPIVFSDLQADQIFGSNRVLYSVASTIHDLSDTVDFE